VAARWEVVATDADPFAWGLYVAPHSLLLPPAGDARYIECLNEAVDRLKIAAVIPGSQAETFFLADHISEVGVPVLLNRKEILPLMTDKLLVDSTLRRMGYPSIRTFPLAAWRECAEIFGYPLVIKPTAGTGASRGVLVAGDETELMQIIAGAEPSAAPCIQPYVGGGDEEFTVGVLTSRDGRLIDSIVMKRKLMGLSLQEERRVGGRTLAISSGYSQGYIVKDDRIQTFCENLARDLQSTGPLNIQLRIHGGEIRVFEIHPRFSGTTPIRADVGLNEVDILLRNLLFGETFGRQPYRTDVAAIRAFEHVIVPIDRMVNRQ
jgi:carbamoyl-phosphate synthase large subunit